MKCFHCGMEVGHETVCFVCGKPPLLKVKETKCSIEIIMAPKGDMEKNKYSCPFCTARRVKEVIAHDDGRDDVIWHLDSKTITGFEVFNWATNPRIENTCCYECGWALPKEDQDRFLEETEEWVRQ